MNARTQLLIKIENKRHDELLAKCNNNTSIKAEVCRHTVRLSSILSKEKGLSL